MERYELAMERIRQIPFDKESASRYHDFFASVSEFIIKTDEFRTAVVNNLFFKQSQDELRDFQNSLYYDCLKVNYKTSFLNPSYASQVLGKAGQVLSALYAEVYSLIKLLAENREEDAVTVLELFIEVYVALDEIDQQSDCKLIEKIIYWYAHDYLDITVPYRIRETLDSDMSFAYDVIMNFDLSDMRYLYAFGDYISEDEIETARYLDSLPDVTLQKMADVYTDGYITGFKVGGKDISKKDTVQIRYNLGFELIVKKAIINFEKLGLKVVITRAPFRIADKMPGRNAGYSSIGANKQFEYDHRYDSAIFFKKAYIDRKLTLIKTSYEEIKNKALLYAGPAVMEIFGVEIFEPENKENTYSYDIKQKELLSNYNNKAIQIQNEYIPGDETSFTIIAWPVPSIGVAYKDIFDEIIHINTLDSKTYIHMQQLIIDVLDKAEYVNIYGKGNNDTNLKINLCKLENPEKQTKFENCVADVNIPLGEVFTTPVLLGTEGVLHVSNVYIGDIQFKNLRLWFDEGRVNEYSCENFDSVKENRKLIEDILLKNHKTLPMGEFAIGTNTTAYAVAKKYDILGRLPILIVEKMGPHFAIGDTCYSFEEDSMTYNPDGKAIVARDNEISMLRKKNVSDAYFGCHTDITIPYDEIGAITAVSADGNKIDIISEGRFALTGLEKLNHAMEKF